MLARAIHALSEVFHCHIKKHPANLPISLTTHHLQHVLPYGYVVSLKADGERVYLFCYHDVTFLLHRNMQLTTIVTELPSITTELFYIFDGEMLSNGSILLFDTLVFESMAVVQYDYLQRYEYTRLFCILGNFQTTMKIPYTVPSRVLFEPNRSIGTWNILTKPVYTTQYIRQMMLQNQSFQNDGLIFMKLRQSYMPYRSCPLSVIKYKNRSDMTIDFHIYNTSLSALGNTGKLEYFARTTNDTNIYNQIWECGLIQNGSQNEWVLLKHRTDKTDPNNIDTVLATMDNIREDIRMHTVIDAL
jgi:hypothetical protein